ncbi:hypothetical protein [Pelagovum pacificum]|uniref:DUF4440 domain-containing protein n=1 Tax=Pelagovum pacificum TaxID=2588711 RepID=A0A5C5GG62_9RHOB|nr:hypothetical protein [Pelagovum pacificum]QQA43112.1 hypothetical protein I8N54_00610 [Pelagovum pacificum]TNY33745.1 hypothetical protein FHY64_10905 [Pelagovum pacificum]
MTRLIIALFLVLCPLTAIAQTPEDQWQARATVEDYFAAINRGSYAAAYDFWEDGGAASGQTLDQFEAGYADTAEVRVFTAPGTLEGAAGSIYATVPLRIEAELNDGTRQRFGGDIVLRRSNVEGSESGGIWKLHSAEIASLGQPGKR